MFNLIVRYQTWPEGRDTFPLGRLLEYTDDALAARFVPRGAIDLPALIQLPTLFVQETQGTGTEVARVGTILRARITGREVVLEYAYEADIPPIPNASLKALAADLDINDFEFSRTHWAVKDVDLFRVLLRAKNVVRQRPTVFQIPEHENIEPALVSAMMPFHPAFDPVYKALQKSATKANLRCRRADDIWENPAIIQDVVSLIDRARVVIADCTGRNPNVFYEIGIAHTLGREVILITQNEADIPFDLRHLRYVPYLNNTQGLNKLVKLLTPRLEGLV